MASNSARRSPGEVSRAVLQDDRDAILQMDGRHSQSKSGAFGVTLPEGPVVRASMMVVSHEHKELSNPD